jgi:UDP-N-acetylmuramoylalanine--D-glutamate ligase
VLGAARSGLAAVEALDRLRPDIALRLVDRLPWEGETPRRVERVVGDEDARLVADVDVLVKSPGVPASARLVVAAREGGVPVWSEVELAFRLLSERNPIVGITGTNGKTTATALCASMLDRGGVPAIAAGNIGVPLVSLAGRLPAGQAIACELSSFQLEDVETFHAQAGVLLNVTPDHLDRHGTLAGYAAAKLRLFERQRPSDVAILCDDDPFVHGLSDNAVPGAGRRVRLRRADAPEDLVEAQRRSRLKGEHNLENALCAATAAAALGAQRDGILQALVEFRPLAHRLEEVGVVDGVSYVDDSKATNVEAALRALSAFDHGLHLILGGSLKGGSFRPLAEAIDDRVERVYLIGQAQAQLERELAEAGVASTRAGDLETAVRLAREGARPGDTVLLSPACASFDQFESYEHRGEVFEGLVRALQEDG